MSLSSAEIKRQILISADKSEIKKKMDENLPGINEGEMIEIGNELEALTRARGWNVVEAYMLRRMNLIGMVLSDKENPDQKGMAKGFIELMQWIHLTIRKRDEILEKEKQKYATKSVSENETKRGKEELSL